MHVMTLAVGQTETCHMDGCFSSRGMLAKREKPVLPLYGKLTGCQCVVERRRAAASMSGAERGRGGIESHFIRQLHLERKVT